MQTTKPRFCNYFALSLRLVPPKTFGTRQTLRGATRCGSAAHCGGAARCGGTARSTKPKQEITFIIRTAQAASVFSFSRAATSTVVARHEISQSCNLFVLLVSFSERPFIFETRRATSTFDSLRCCFLQQTRSSVLPSSLSREARSE